MAVLAYKVDDEGGPYCEIAATLSEGYKVIIVLEGTPDDAITRANVDLWKYTFSIESDKTGEELYMEESSEFFNNFSDALLNAQHLATNKIIEMINGTER